MLTKKASLTGSIVVTLFLLGTTCSEAAFEDLGCGARPLGMGGAFTAVADDINAPLWNVAGLARLTEPEFTAFYSKLYWGLEDDIIGNGFVSLAMPPFKGEDMASIGWVFLNSELYNENTIIVSYARKLFEGFYAGLSGRYMTKKYGANEYTVLDPVFADKHSASGIGVDLGLLYETGIFSIGASASNINQPDISLKDTDKVPMSVRGGIAFDVGPCLLFDDVITAIDVAYVNNTTKDLKVVAGIENWFLDKLLAFRVGGGVGNNEYADLTTGIGCQINKEGWLFMLDYSFDYALSGVAEKTAGSHRLSLTLRAAPVEEEIGKRDRRKEIRDLLRKRTMKVGKPEGEAPPEEKAPAEKEPIIIEEREIKIE